MGALAQIMRISLVYLLRSGCVKKDGGAAGRLDSWTLKMDL